MKTAHPEVGFRQSLTMSSEPLATNGKARIRLGSGNSRNSTTEQRKMLAPLAMQEAIDALVSNCAKIRIVDVRSGRWLEIDGNASIVPYLESPNLGNVKSAADGSLKLATGPETKSRRILNSWKDIAAYMGRGVRTVQRYEATLGLPVRRAAGQERSSVLAFPHELDAWLQARPVRIQTSMIESVGTEPLRGSKSQLSISA